MYAGLHSRQIVTAAKTKPTTDAVYAAVEDGQSAKTRRVLTLPLSKLRIKSSTTYLILSFSSSG